jgi:hypothetical protein
MEGMKGSSLVRTTRSYTTLDFTCTSTIRVKGNPATLSVFFVTSYLRIFLIFSHL